jgi:hypothetical protein
LEEKLKKKSQNYEDSITKKIDDMLNDESILDFDDYEKEEFKSSIFKDYEKFKDSEFKISHKTKSRINN